MIEWKQIEEAPDYWINNRGEILSKRFEGKEKLLKRHINRYTGYQQICLAISEAGEEHVRKTFTIHRLVGKYFVPNPNNLNRINHKDLDKMNNHYWNLEWVSQEENIHHYYNSDVKNKPRNMKPVEVWDVDGNFMGEFPSVSKAAKEIGCSPSVLHDSLTGRVKKPQRFIVKYIQQ